MTYDSIEIRATRFEIRELEDRLEGAEDRELPILRAQLTALWQKLIKLQHSYVARNIFA